MAHYLYIIRCSDNYLYTGITWNLQKRIKEHQDGSSLIKKNRRPLKLVYAERYDRRENAAKREKEIKGWRREKKEKLIENGLQ